MSKIIGVSSTKGACLMRRYDENIQHLPPITDLAHYSVAVH